MVKRSGVASSNGGNTYSVESLKKQYLEWARGYGFEDEVACAMLREKLKSPEKSLTPMELHKVRARVSRVEGIYHPATPSTEGARPVRTFGQAKDSDPGQMVVCEHCQARHRAGRRQRHLQRCPVLRQRASNIAVTQAGSESQRCGLDVPCLVRRRSG